MKSFQHWLFLGLFLFASIALLGQSAGLDRLRELNQQAEAAAATSSTRSAELASQAITYALSLKESIEPGANLRAVSQQEIRAYLILGDAFRSENNDRKATRYYRQGFQLAEAIEDPVLAELSQSKLNALGRDPEDLNSRFSKFGRQLVDDLETMVEEGRMNEEVKTAAEDATLSVMEWQARQAQRRGEFAKSIELYQQTLPYYLSSRDTMAYRTTCAEISTLYLRLGNTAESNRYKQMSQSARDKAIPASSNSPNALGDLRELVEATEKQEQQIAAEEARTQQARQSYLQEAEAFLRSGRVEESIESLRKANELQERIARLQRQRQLDSAATAHFIETQLQEIELLTQQQEIQEQKIRESARTRNFLLLATLLIVAIAGLITYLFFTKRKAHRVLTQTYQDLNQTHEALKSTQLKLVEAEKMASLGQLTAGIAHEINNPVNFISGNLHPLREDVQEVMDLLQLYEQTAVEAGLEQQLRTALDKSKALQSADIRTEIRELLDGIEEGANRTTEIVQGLRTFARMDGGAPQIFDVHQGIDSTLALLKNQLTGIEVIRDFGSLPPLEGYPGKMNQVFMNLFSNAIQAMPGGGWLRIRTRQTTGRQVEIQIQDTGTGIPEEIRQKIFDPFFTTKQVGEGTGLGLSISLGIIKLHNGDIRLESEPGQGTTVSLILPAAFQA